MTISKHRKEIINRYLKSEKGKEKLKRKYKKRIAQNRAKDAINWQVRKGAIKPAKQLNCFDCGKQASHYHHNSYKAKDRLKVVPLCIPCHHTRHGQPPPSPSDD